MKNKKMINKHEYTMLIQEGKNKYVECSLCDNHFIMNEGGIYEGDNDINVCDDCLINKQLN